MNKSVSVEYVLGMSAQVLHDHGVGQGFSAGTFRLDEMLVHAELRPRHEVENDPAWKHFASYAVVCAEGRVLSYQRTTAGSESRLHGLRSIGIGGHVNTEDGAVSERWDKTALDRAAVRELHEEIVVPGEYRMDFIGFVNDDSNPVGRVHVGLVYRCELTTTDQSAARETALTDCRMLTRRELVDSRDLYETWSRFLIDKALDRILSPQP